MNSIPISMQGGIVVRMAALREKNVSDAALLEAMEATAPFGSADTQLLSFGPSFGEEAMSEFVQRLKVLGLEYVDDFFCFNMDVPEWCGLRAELKE